MVPVPMKKGDIVFSLSDAGSLRAVHAALSAGDDGVELFEPVGNGLKRQPSPPEIYGIYRYEGPMGEQIRQGAVWMARSLYAQVHRGEGFGRYNRVRAALSQLRPPTGAQPQHFMFGGNGVRKMACLNAIFRCFAGAAHMAGLRSLPIPDREGLQSPEELEAALRNAPHWRLWEPGLDANRMMAV